MRGKHLDDHLKPAKPCFGGITMRFSDAPRVRLLSSACAPLEGVRGGVELPPPTCTEPPGQLASLRSWTSPTGVEWRIASRRLADGRRVEVVLNRETDTTVLLRSRRQLVIVLLLALCVAGPVVF